MLRSTRQQHHQRIAQVLEAQFPETVETQPELLAHHYTEAGLSAQAIPYWQRAGQRALERSANLEAVATSRKGLEVLAILPDTPERAQQELAMQTTLGPALVVTKGLRAPEVLHVYTRARELCQQVGETPQLFQVLRGLWFFYLIRLELRTARELGEHLLTLAQQVGDPALRLEAHYALGNTLNYLGEFAAAQAHFEQGIALYDPQQHRAHAFRYGQDPGVACRYYAAVTLWWLGYPDQALQRSHEALTLARELAHPFSLGSALFFAAWLHQFRREWHLTHERAEAAIALAAEQGFAHFVAGGTVFGGGRWPSGLLSLVQDRGKWRRAWPRCTRAWRPGAPQGPRCCGRIVWPCWPRPRRQVGQREAGLTLWPRRWPWPMTRGSAAGKPRCIGSRASYCWRARRTHACGGGNLLSSGPRHRPPAAGQVAGAAGRHEPESPVAAAGQARRSPRAVGTDLRLVHRGL